MNPANRFILLSLFSLIAIYSCVSVIEFDLEEEGGQLIIIGEITNNPGPYQVQINRSISFFDATSNLSATAVNDATVVIYSLSGQFEKLQFVSNGTYQTTPNGIRGKVGESYFLTIEVDGEIFMSSVETMPPVPEIDSISYGLSYVQQNNSEGVILDIPKIDVFVNFQDDEGAENFYLWKWSGIAERRTFPELHTVRFNHIDSIIPLPCSGDDENPCTCCTCWVQKPERNPISLFNDRYTNGNYISSFHAFSIPATTEYFDKQFQLSISQYSITKSVYDFWNQITEQEETQSSLFAVPLAPITTNIRNINDEEDLVFGVFSVAGVSQFENMIDKNEFDLIIHSDSIRESCLILPNSVNVKPREWLN